MLTLFEGKLKNLSCLYNFVEGIRGMTPKVLFCFTNNGISCKSTDENRVVMIDAHFGKDNFDNFIIIEDFVLSLELKYLSTVMKSSYQNGKGKIVIQKACDGSKPELILEVEALEKYSEFLIKTETIEAEYLQIKAFQYSCTINMPVSEFSKILHDLSQFGAFVKIKPAVNNVEFSSADANIRAKITVWKQSNPGTRTTAGRVLRSATMISTRGVEVSAKYLQALAKRGKAYGQVLISLSPNGPVILEFSAGKNTYLKFHLPPKSED